MIPPIQQHSEAFATSPQLQPEDLAAVAQLGYRTIINNRPDGEAPGQPLNADLEAEAVRLGLGYVFIPVGRSLSAEQVEAFSEALAASPGPVLAFCASGTRSSVLYQYSRRP
jgi:uncharacterized protein (TIGR01244 family)